MDPTNTARACNQKAMWRGHGPKRPKRGWRPNRLTVGGHEDSKVWKILVVDSLLRCYSFAIAHESLHVFAIRYVCCRPLSLAAFRRTSLKTSWCTKHRWGLQCKQVSLTQWPFTNTRDALDHSIYHSWQVDKSRIQHKHHHSLHSSTTKCTGSVTQQKDLSPFVVIISLN